MKCSAIGRISRIKSIRQNGQVAAQAGPVIAPHVPPVGPKTTEDWDAAKKAFVDKWLRELP